MSKKDNNNNNTGDVVDLTTRIKQVKTSKDQEVGKALELGLDTFQYGLEDAQGFLTITFDTEGQPSVIHAGELDLIRTVGTLDFVKNELLNNVFQFDDFEEFDEEVNPTDLFDE